MAIKPTYEELEQKIKELEQTNSDLKRTGASLKKKSEMLDHILTASTVGIGHSRNRKIVWGNRALYEMFGFSKEEEFKGKDTRIIYANEEEYKRVGNLMKAHSRQKVFTTQVQFKRYDNQREFTGLFRSNILDTSDLGKGIIVNIIATTELKRMDSSKEYYNI